MLDTLIHASALRKIRVPAVASENLVESFRALEHVYISPRFRERFDLRQRYLIVHSVPERGYAEYAVSCPREARVSELYKPHFSKYRFIELADVVALFRKEAEDQFFAERRRSILFAEGPDMDVCPIRIITPEEESGALPAFIFDGRRYKYVLDLLDEDEEIFCEGEEHVFVPIPLPHKTSRKDYKGVTA